MTTEAGRLPYCIPESEWCDGHNRHLRVCIAEASEARAALLAELDAGVRGLESMGTTDEWDADGIHRDAENVERAAVLDLIRAQGTAKEPQSLATRAHPGWVLTLCTYPHCGNNHYHATEARREQA